jgi:hypothetical protein
VPPCIALINGEALWTYLTTPFLLAMEGVPVEENPGGKAKRRGACCAYFPGSIETHNLVQEFFFGEDLMLRRHDHSANIAGGFAAAQLTSDHVTADGILPANPAPRLSAGSRPAADPGTADGVDRYHQSSSRSDLII